MSNLNTKESHMLYETLVPCSGKLVGSYHVLLFRFTENASNLYCRCVTPTSNIAWYGFGQWERDVLNYTLTITICSDKYYIGVPLILVEACPHWTQFLCLAINLLIFFDVLESLYTWPQVAGKYNL